MVSFVNKVLPENMMMLKSVGSDTYTQSSVHSKSLFLLTAVTKQQYTHVSFSRSCDDIIAILCTS